MPFHFTDEEWIDMACEMHLWTDGQTVDGDVITQDPRNRRHIEPIEDEL